MVIQLTHQDTDPWDSAEDSSASSESISSTPGYKRGRHHEDMDIDEQAVKLIEQKGIKLAPLKGIKQVNQLSLLLLADMQLGEWPWNDKKCNLHLRPRCRVRDWGYEIRSGHIDIQTQNVVLYLEGLLRWQDAPPIKNTLHSLCKVIRGQQPASRIYVCNMLPRVMGSGSPVGPNISNFNFTLQEVVHSVGRALGKVHALSIHEHFVDKDNKPITPVQKYFTPQGLSYLGCLIFRECVLHEGGFKTYWFEGPRPTKQVQQE